MDFQRNNLAAALARVLGVGAAIAVSGAWGQAQNPDVPSNTRPEARPDIRVEVTGSNICCVEGEGALPVTVITREEIDRSGATTPMELLQQISANNSLGATSISNSVGALTLSAQTASLRGLGGGRTLVLINGHRVDAFAGEVQGVQGVNLAAIPFQAIERVEILKDGASAIYGSDAIAGVINFITRSDYTGAEVTALYGTPTRGGGDQYQASGTVGFGDLAKDRWNVVLSAQYNEQKSLDQVDRTYSNSSYIPGIGLVGISSNTNPGLITTGGIGAVTNRGGTARLALSPEDCAPSTFFNDAVLGTGCFFDPSRVHGVNMIPHEKTWNFFGSGRFQINSDWQAYGTALYSRDESRLVIQPGPVSSLFTYGPLNDIPSTITLQPTSPFYPHQIAADAGVDGQPLDVRYRTFDNGFRDQTDTNENWEVIGGVKGTWRNWDFDGSLFYSEGKTTEHINGGFQDYTRLLPILNSGVVNFFGPNTPDVIALEQTANYVGDAFRGTSKNYGAQARTSGEIYRLPAGSLALAFGVEARREEFDQIMDPALESGNIIGYGGPIKSTRDKSRDVYAAFTELNVPIVKTLGANAAVRYDHYSDFGSTTNPKFSLRWQPTRTVLVRGSYGTGFLAPSLSVVHAAVRRRHANRPHRSHPLPGHDGHGSRLQHAVRRAVRRQREPQAGGIGADELRHRHRADPQCVVQRRLVQDQPQEHDRQRHLAADRAGRPRAVRLARHARPGRSELSRAAGQNHPDQPALHQPRRRAHPRPRYRGPLSHADHVVGPSVAERCGDLLHQLRRAESRWLVYERGRQHVRHGGDRRGPTLEAIRVGHVGSRPLVGDAREHLPDVVHRPADGPQRQHALGGLVEPVGPAGFVHGIQELEADARREEPVRSRPAGVEPAKHVHPRLRPVVLRQARAVRLR
jgi:outer membrane receptor protein involved in Fe transport